MHAMLGEWNHIERDFQQVYGIDLSDPETRRRSWRWFKVRLGGLLQTESRIKSLFNPDKQK